MTQESRSKTEEMALATGTYRAGAGGPRNLSQIAELMVAESPRAVKVGTTPPTELVWSTTAPAKPDTPSAPPQPVPAPTPSTPHTEPPFQPGPPTPERRTTPGKEPRILPGC